MALRRIPVPIGIEISPDGRTLQVRWPGNTATAASAFALRTGCPCAGCVDEMTGKRTLDPDRVDPEVAIVEAGTVGRYALRFRFSDGHDTGIFTYEALHRNDFAPPSQEEN